MKKFVLFFNLLIVSLSGFTQENSLEMTLKKSISAAMENNLEIKAEEFKKKIALTDLDLIKGETSPKITATAGVGPINGKTGNYLGYSDKNTWGAEWITSIDAKIPLYIWGREKNLKIAAGLNSEINQLDVTKKQIEITYKIKEAYYGLQYTLSLLDFVTETEKDLTEAVKALSEKSNKKEDMLRLEVFKYQVEEKRQEIEKSIKIAKLGLSFYTGKKDYTIDRAWIELDERELKDVNYYQDLLLKNYPDLIKINKGIVAKNNLLESEIKSELPMIGAIVKYDLAYTNQRTSSHNPFIYDQYNHSDVGFGFGLTWDLDFGIKKSKQDKLNFEIAELKARDHFAKTGLATLVSKAVIEVDASINKTKSLQKAYKSAKKWLTNIETSVGLGLTPAKDIIDAYTTRALVYKDYYESIYNNQLAWANLSQAVGTEVDPLLN